MFNLRNLIDPNKGFFSGGYNPLDPFGIQSKSKSKSAGSSLKSAGHQRQPQPQRQHQPRTQRTPATQGQNYNPPWAQPGPPFNNYFDSYTAFPPFSNSNSNSDSDSDSDIEYPRATSGSTNISTSGPASLIEFEVLEEGRGPFRPVKQWLETLAEGERTVEELMETRDFNSESGSADSPWSGETPRWTESSHVSSSSPAPAQRQRTPASEAKRAAKVAAEKQKKEKKEEERKKKQEKRKGLRTSLKPTATTTTKPTSGFHPKTQSKAPTTTTTDTESKRKTPAQVAPVVIASPPCARHKERQNGDVGEGRPNECLSCLYRLRDFDKEMKEKKETERKEAERKDSERKERERLAEELAAADPPPAYETVPEMKSKHSKIGFLQRILEKARRGRGSGSRKN